MTRSVSTDFRTAAEAANSSETYVIFATITHPDLVDPICVNSDIADYEYNGLTYFGCAFSLSLLSDDDNPPRGQCSIPNVDQRIGEAILSLSSSPRIKIELLARSDFDDGDPRKAIAVPVVELSAPELFLRNVSCDAIAFTGDIYSYDVSTEPWPKIRCTPDLLPGLFR